MPSEQQTYFVSVCHMFSRYRYNNYTESTRKDTDNNLLSVSFLVYLLNM